jgi:hypothetical protein
VLRGLPGVEGHGRGVGAGVAGDEVEVEARDAQVLSCSTAAARKVSQAATVTDASPPA